MGQSYGIKCSKCDYGVVVRIGAGFTADKVFYGQCNNLDHDWDPTLHDDSCGYVEPLLAKIVDDESVKDRALALLENGAKPPKSYRNHGYELYACPNCMHLDNKYYFKLILPNGFYEPDYRCSNCNTSLHPVMSRPDNGDMLYGHGEHDCEILFSNLRKLGWKCPKCSSSEMVYDKSVIERMWD